jgi:UDP-N-acetylbacillosamine N-acetyltransferase
VAEGRGGRLIVWGASGHAKVVADIARLTGWEVVGFLDDVDPGRRGREFFGALVLGRYQDVLAAGAFADGTALALGVGDNAARLARAREALAAGLELPCLMHPSAVRADSALFGAGCVVAAGALLNPDVRVGDAGLVNTGAGVDHDGVIGAGAHIAPQAVLAGGVRVGERSLVGVGAVVLPRVAIGHDVTVGGGSTVTRDLPDGVVAIGSPARVTRAAGASRA